MKSFADKALIWTIALVIALAGLAAILLFIISPFAWWPLPAAILITVIIASAAGAHYTPQAVYYSGALVAMAPEAILVAALSTALSYIGALYPASIPFTPSVFAVFIGLAIGLVFWLLSAVVYCFFHLSAVDGANSRTYGQLIERLANLDNRLQVLCSANPGLANTAAANEAKSLSDKIRNSLYPNDPGAQELQGISKGSVPTDPAARANIPGGVVAPKDPISLSPMNTARAAQPLDGLQWVMGHGYISLWQWMHAAEEAMIEIDESVELVGYILHDKSRLDDSTISHRDDLIDLLKQASHNLCVPAAEYVDTPGTGKGRSVPAQQATPAEDKQAQAVLPWPLSTMAEHMASLSIAKGQSAPVPQATPAGDKQARAVLREVRSVINQFRDDRWDGLVHHRNYLMVALILTHLVAYTLLAVFILLGAPKRALVAASVYFLVGALIGLFNHLRVGPGPHFEIDDYGLNHARLIATPVFSGVAAICGVVLFGLAPALLNAQLIAPQSATTTPTLTAVGRTTISRVALASAPAVSGSFHALTLSSQRALADTPTRTPTGASQPLTATPTPAPKPTATPTPTVAIGAAAPPTHFPPLADIFDLDKNLFGLVVAATFGLAPAALIKALQKQTDNYKLDLNSTEAQDSTEAQNSTPD